MKKKLTFLFIFFIISINCASAVEITPYFALNYHLHNLFESYSNLRRSADLKQYDEMGKSLKNVDKSVVEIQKVLAKNNVYRAKLDRNKLVHNVDKLNITVKELMLASGKGELNETKLFTDDMLDVCLGCHTRGRLQYLFNLTFTRTTFSMYMHDLVEYMKVTKINIESGNNPGKLADSMRLIDYYLELLEGDFPEKAPSEAISDKDAFNKRLKESGVIWKEVLEKGAGIKMADLDNFKKSVNGMCVYCHEPERYSGLLP